MICKNCGADNPDGSRFCKNCGAELTQGNNSDYSYYKEEPQQNPYQQHSEPEPQPGSTLATASLVLGIIGVICWFFGYSAIISLILGIIGLVLASRARQEGNTSGIRTGGFVCSLIAVIGGAIVLVALVACVACVGAIGWSALTA